MDEMEKVKTFLAALGLLPCDSY